MNSWKWLGSFALALSALVGCRDDDARPAPMTDAGADAGSDASVDLGRDTGTRDAGADDGNDTFAEAVALTLGAATGAMATIGTVEDKDYFSFAATANQWIIITTTANADDDDTKVDTFITLFDSTMTAVAANDDAVPRASTDSELIFHAVTAGTYYIEVQEFSDFTDMSPEAHPADMYELEVAALNIPIAGVTEDAETGNDAASATPLEFFAAGNGILVGTYAAVDDVDVFSITTTALQIVQATFMPAGATGYGSTTPPRSAWVTAMDGTTILARISDLTMLNEISPSLAAGSYLLWIDRPAGTVGSNDFYVSKVFRGAENTPEAAEATNGVLTTPELVTLTVPMGSTGLRNGFIIAQLGDGDVDHFAIDVLAGEQAGVSCGAETSGSGVRGLNVALLDSTGTVVAMMNETTAASGAIIPATTVAPGRYLVRLTKTAQDAAVTSTWVRCGLRATVPAAP